MNRTFGVEIEAYGLTLRQAADAIRAAGVSCAVEHYGHTTPTRWKVVTDASINGVLGFEVVSPVLRGESGLDQVRRVMNALSGAGAKVNKSCGLHVHIGAADFTVTEFKNIAKNYLVFEDFFDAVMPRSRRANDNAYIKSIRGRFGDHSHAAAARGVKAINALTSIDAVIETLNGQRHEGAARYFKLNLTAYWRHRTIEFRQHSGTTDAEKACHWIRLLMGFVDKAATSRVRARAPETVEVPRCVVFRQFFQVFGLSGLRPHFVERARVFEVNDA